MKNRGRVLGGLLLAAFLGAGHVAAGQSAAFVSANQLRNPMPRKAEAFFRKFLGNPTATPQAVADLRKNLRDPELAPYALKALGMRHINSGQFREAIGELMEASRAMPWDAQTMGLWSVATYVSGAREEGSEIAQRTLSIDPRDSGANLVLGLSALDRKDFNNPEIFRDFTKKMHLASQAFPGAGLVLWEYYRLRGQKEEAEREMEEFRRREPQLPPGNREEVLEWISRRLPR